MERLEMLRKARQLICETLEYVAGLSNAEYRELCKLRNEEGAVQELARRLSVAIANELIPKPLPINGQE